METEEAKDFEMCKAAYSQAARQRRLQRKRDAAREAYHRDPEKVRARVYLRLCKQGKIAKPKRLAHYLEYTSQKAEA